MSRSPHPVSTEASEAPVYTSVGGVVLAGGTAARLDGVDKGGVEVGGRTLLDRALDALVDADDVVVVGPAVRTERPVTFLREDPVGGGPAAGLLAGLAGFPTAPDLVLVLAVDMPWVSAATFRRLRAACGPDGPDALDGALLADAGGRRQPLCAAYRTRSLQRVRPAYEHEHGLPVHRLVAGLRLAEVTADAAEAEDVDTWADLTRARRRVHLGPQ